ncbi:amidase [Achromobacter agilis]|uniref:Acylamidase n=1 Tax=Achromobacter agilis TaxID=1353888 RepID=A0A446CE03_9BURK|nr:amidase family protein [Achromobacter agilis]SSW66110.1 Acylamidase [Achromobacter agilis]
MDELTNMDALTLAAAIRRGQVSPVEAVSAVLERIAARADLNAFITVTADQALAAAREAEAAVRRGDPLGPLHGVPYSVKDLTLTAGVRTTMGSAMFEDFVPREDAVAVARAKAAGAILIGKTTTPEFGHKQSTDAPLFGRTLNPIDPRYTCGASSGGAAVAVAAGMGPLALGTDGGGSIRIPASCCGIVGMKATLGAIPNLQPADLFGANSYVGPMARNVADTALLYGVLQGTDRRDPYGQLALPARGPAQATLAGLRVAYLPACGNPVDPEVLEATNAAVRRMEEDGAHVEPVSLDFVSLERHFLVILESVTASRVGPRLDAFRERLDPSLVATVERGREHGAAALLDAIAARTQAFNALQAVFERHDVLVSPTLSAPPLPVTQDPNGIVEIAGKLAGTIRGAWYPYTYPMNLTGHPALSMPCGRSAGGLPIGLQLCGRWHEDWRLLDVAARVERLLAG